MAAATLTAFAAPLPGEPCEKLPIAPNPFPDTLCAYVWRNWGLVPKDKLAKVVYTTPEAITEIAEDFGLPPDPEIAPEWHRKGYITILRRNWHLLPYNQILELLDMSREELRFSLIEDDFLFHKLGGLKPKCDMVIAVPEVIKGGRAVRRQLGKILKEEGLDPAAPMEPRFSFIKELSAISNTSSASRPSHTSPFDFRMIFSYFADYGDPLGDPEIASFPEGLLEKLSAHGVNAVWLHTVLRTLAKDPKYPEFGVGAEERIANLKKLVARATKYNIKVYLYMNEPRGLPEAFYAKSPERMAMRGVPAAESSGIFAMCTSCPETHRWVHDAIKQVFSNVPGLGGIFTITMSENLTNCASRGQRDKCPRCKERTVAEIVAEINNTMIAGMRTGNPAAEALIWDWAWPSEETEAICAKLDKQNCRIMSVSENRMPFVRGGVKGIEQDYSISIVGPGESAKKLWGFAKENGIPRVAKVQANCSWELSPFPYLPVMDLVAEHAANLAKEDVSGVMLSWSLGCYPAPNLRVFSEFRTTDKDGNAVLDRLAEELYPGKAAQARAAWSAFSSGFREYPFSLSTIYSGPQHWGVAAPLYTRATGYKATMVGIPYDDLKSWRAQYPADIWANQMQKVADGFSRGCQLMEGIATKKELDLFRAQQMHFAESADLARFVVARDSGDLDKMKEIAQRQLARAKEYWPLVRADSRIGYESSNHYFFTPNDVLEKVLTCREVLDTARLAPPKTCKDGKRPYEMVWANRRADEMPPVDRLESGAGWKTECTDAAARVSSANDRLLFGDGTLRLDYRATGEKPVVKFVREQPLKLPKFDTFSVWIYGNNFYGRAPKDTPMTHLAADFVDADGKPFSFRVSTILHREWCKFQMKVPAEMRERALKGGCSFTGFTLTGGKNKEDRRLDLTSICAFVEELKPLTFSERPKRGVQIFKDQPQGANTGAGKLPFPTVDTTVVPPASEIDGTLEFRYPEKPGVWDDLAFRINKGEWVALAKGGGVWPRSEADKAEVKFHRIGNSLVADVVVKGGQVEELRFGGADLPADAKAVPLPYYTWGNQVWDARPSVLVAKLKEGTHFISATLDWTQSNCSEPFAPVTGTEWLGANGGARYIPKTDGNRNDVYERFVWTVSKKFEETLPFIPNPPSPWKHLTGRTCWISSGASKDRSPNLSTWFWHARKGIRKLIVTDHETGWRDGDESFTFRTDPAPGKGGDKGQYDYTRKLIDGYGFRYGPYNNFTDYAPVNGYWHSDMVARTPDGNLKLAWSRCTGPKPLYALEMCEKLAPIIKQKFDFNTAYCDVHTAVTPWSRTDYDWRSPGAGTFAQTFYAYGEIMLIQKKTWEGPVSSEGRHQWMYSGLTDQNYAQDSTYRLFENPWIVDFDLLRMHPLTCDHGMGFAGMFFGDDNIPTNAWDVLDQWMPATLAFGHSAFLLPQNPSYAYYMTLAIASRYSQQNVKTIRYGDAQGKLLTTSEAVVSGEIAHNHIMVEYDGGTRVIVNGDPDGEWFVLPHEAGTLALPQWGFYCRSGDVVVFSGLKGSNRVDFCRGGAEDGYIFMHGRDQPTTFPGGATDNMLIRLKEPGGTEEVIPDKKTGGFEIGLPYAAQKIVGLHTSTRREMGEISFAVDEGGWTRFKRRGDCYSYRVTLPDGYAEPSADNYEKWALAPKGFKAPPQAAKAAKPRKLPQRFVTGVLTPDGREIPIPEDCGASAKGALVNCGGVHKHCLRIHPPYMKGVQGSVFIRYRLSLGKEEKRLKGLVGKVDGTTPGDGILYKVAVKEAGALKIIAEHRVTEHAWQEISADLSPYAGQQVELYLIADPGGNTYGDNGGWADVTLSAD